MPGAQDGTETYLRLAEKREQLVGSRGPELAVSASGDSGSGGNVSYIVTSANPPGKWCGQSQPHEPHIWTDGPMGLYTQCSGHS